MKTTNYDWFAYMPTNRSINPGLVDRLVKSISAIGYIEARPILVNNKMIIIDGQHRFEACKKLGLPIIYEISDVDMSKAMIALNMNQQIWRLTEYVESWAKSGIDCYKQMVDFEKRYKLGMSNTITICTSSRSGRSAMDIRRGKEFEINPKSEDIAKFILTCKTYFAFYSTKFFVESVAVLFKKTTAENCQKVLNHIQPMRQQATTSNYLAFYENVLNKYKRNTDSYIVLL